MIGRTISHYRITRQLGAGGMGVVYEALDLKLDRPVALKFLPPELTRDPEAKARFVHEAKAASALDHPNICTVYEIDKTDDGQLFIAMACYEGETLRERIARGPLPLDEAIDIAQDIAQGLAKAHEKEILHRDIKPANVLLTSDKLVKILDFGLAKLSKGTRVTKTGSTLGTVAYMSPEQARGEETDHRTDLWCLGTVLYEMVTGRLAFQGDHEQAVIYAILNEEIEPATGVRSGVPLELERLIDRCLEKNPDARYQTAADLASDLRRIQGRLVSGPQPTVTALRGSEPRGVRPRRRWPGHVGAVVVATLTLVLALAIYPRLAGQKDQRPDSGRKMLVVLPFENLGAPEDEYFADGITEEITSRLTAIKDLGVISRTSALHFKNSDKTIQEIGDELKVDYILEGTVRWERSPGGGSRVRVTPRLIRVTDDSHVWAEMYDDDFEAIFAVQSRIAGQVADKLGIALTGNEQRVLDARPTENVVAYQFYLRGIDHIIFGHRPETDYRQAQQLFEQAIAIDPDFALAYAKLSRAHLGLYFFGYDHTAQRLGMVKQAIDKALELDPDLAEAHRELGYYYYQGLLDYENALTEFSRVAQVLPNDARLLQDISYIWRRQGRLREALANQHSAFELNPTDAGLCVEIANTCAGLGEYEEALSYCDMAIDMAPENHWGYFLKSIVLLNSSGDVQAAQTMLDLCPNQGVNVVIWAQYYFALLDRDYGAALDLLKNVDGDLIRMQSGYLPVSMLQGVIYDCLGQRELAIPAFESTLVLLEPAVRDNPDDARIHSSLGITYAGLGRKKEAVAAGRKAVEIYPVSKDAMLGVDRMMNLAQIYAMVGEVGPALELIRNILSLSSAYTIYNFELHPCFDAVREDPGYQEIRNEFGREPR